MKLFFLGLLSLSLTSRSKAQDCVSSTNTYTAEVDLFASQYGFFTFAECPGIINPTIGIKVGEEYTFSQADRSNYYHPMGFAYAVDGALEGSDELEPGITPPGSSSTCADDLTCPAPIYFKDGVMLGNYTNLSTDPADYSGTENFGLDDYEPDFFYPLPDWAAGSYSIKLKFDQDDIDQDIFYFCHIHAGMTGRIKILDSNGDPVVSDDAPVLPYSYEEPDEFDANCGTAGLSTYALPNDECPEKFVCLDGTEDNELQEFAECVDAMNCAMLAGMTIKGVDEVQGIFAYQMIPHHVNAVNMAKALLKTGTMDDCEDLTDESSACDYERVVREIIVVQNFQIQSMESALELLELDEESDCNVKIG